MSLNMLSAVNENNVALANIKFDFSLVKVEAPEEYLAFGQSLSRNRRNDAEDGYHHRTARRLGALFEQLIPSTPKLIKAYGKRACEILETGGVNPQGSPKDGAFQAFVGADGTAMWAAATSGISSLGVYLLACFLARAWEASEAISIWVELVEGRRNDILRDINDYCNVSDSSRMGILQDISRDDLRRWDASARAWLQSADKAKLTDHVQFLLILKNIQLPFSSGSSTYRQVIDSWRHSMEALEHLLCGEAQEISNRTVLLAFSAWHIYPDLVVLGDKITKVTFGDKYANTSGIGTIAREPRFSNEARGSSWSLSLSHYRYYGDPVIAESNLDFTKVSVEQLRFVALGSLFGHWRIAHRDILQACKWLQGLWFHLQAQTSSVHVLRFLNEHKWLQLLAEAAEKLTTHEGVHRTVADQLVNFGRRRGKSFLTCCRNCVAPYFGLANPCLLTALASSVEEEVDLFFLREIAQQQGLHTSEAFIRLQTTSATHILEEVMTAVPHIHTAGSESVHGRWISVRSSSLDIRNDDTTKQLAKGLLDLEKEVQQRAKDIECRGEHVIRVGSSPVEKSEGKWKWLTPPPIFEFQEQFKYGMTEARSGNGLTHPAPCDKENAFRCFGIDADRGPAKTYDPRQFRRITKMGKYELLVERDAMYRRGSEEKETPWEIPDMNLCAALDICSQKVKPKILAQYLMAFSSPCLTPKIYDGRNPPDKHSRKRKRSDEDGCQHPYNVSSKFDAVGLSQSFTACRSWITSLTALVAISDLYSTLHGAMISLKIVSKLLAEAAWLPKHTCPSQEFQSYDERRCDTNLSLKRAGILACIVNLETGEQNLEPDELEETLAIASGNSLFVIGSLLADPFDTEGEQSVRRITGNIGKPGISLLVAPVNPMIRPASQEYNWVEHAAYNGRRENKFRSTSLHLSFTDWTMPVEARNARTGQIDQDIHIVESVVSVFESGKWVADLDILSINFDDLFRFKAQPPCLGHGDEVRPCDYVSIDNWEELIDHPQEVAFFRANGNWAARLAAVSILCQKGQSHSIGLLGPGSFCLMCLERDHGVCHIENYESQLPSICID